MKKATKKFVVLILSIVLLSNLSSSTKAYAVEEAMSITLQIEGIEENLYYVTQEIPYKNTLTLKDALSYIDLQEESYLS